MWRPSENKAALAKRASIAGITLPFLRCPSSVSALVLMFPRSPFRPGCKALWSSAGFRRSWVFWICIYLSTVQTDKAGRRCTNRACCVAWPVHPRELHYHHVSPGGQPAAELAALAQRVQHRPPVPHRPGALRKKDLATVTQETSCRAASSLRGLLGLEQSPWGSDEQGLVPSALWSLLGRGHRGGNPECCRQALLQQHHSNAHFRALMQRDPRVTFNQ